MLWYSVISFLILRLNWKGDHKRKKEHTHTYTIITKYYFLVSNLNTLFISLLLHNQKGFKLREWKRKRKSEKLLHVSRTNMKVQQTIKKKRGRKRDRKGKRDIEMTPLNIFQRKVSCIYNQISPKRVFSKKHFVDLLGFIFSI